MKKLSKVKSDRGSVTVFVVAAMLFMLIVVSIAYMNMSNKKVNQQKQIKQIQEEYNTNTISNEQMKEKYEEIALKMRLGIEVGDYVTYTSPTASVDLETTDTGYSEKQTLPQKTLFRVMEIKEDGSMLLMGAMTSEDQKIYFKGANGYNNAVYTLNAKCNELYKNDAKRITARSIKVEDITDKFNDNGKKKLTDYVSTEVGKLSTGDYIKSVDTDKKTVTYQTRTKYPDIFQYEAGGKIGDKATTGKVGQSESYSGYDGLTTNTTGTDTTSLTVSYTHYNTLHNASDFDSKYGDTSKLSNMFFGADTTYWLASRCVRCDADYAYFSLRWVRSSFGALTLCNSFGGDVKYNYCVCPVVVLPSSVQVDKCDGPNSDTNAHEVK